MTNQAVELEKSFKAQPEEYLVGSIPEPFRRLSVEERTHSSPRDNVSSTHAPTIFPAASSSLVSIQDLASVEEVIESLAKQNSVASVVPSEQAAQVIIDISNPTGPSTAAPKSSIPDLAQFSSEHQQEIKELLS